MEEIRKKNTAWLETIRSFFAPEKNIEDEKNSGYEEWKRANINSIDQEAIANLEKMIERQSKKTEKQRYGNNKKRAESSNEKVKMSVEEQRQQGEEQER